MASRYPSVFEMGTTINEEDICLQQFVDSEASVHESREDKTEILIGEIQAYPILWNKQSPEYKESHKKRLVWAEISLRLGLNVESIKSKWKNLCDSYKKCLDREREFSKSGSASFKQPRCRYYDQLTFLRDVITNRQTISNLALPSSSPLSPLPLDFVGKSSPAPSFTSNSSYEADEFRPMEPSFETISRKASTAAQGKTSSVKRSKRAADMDPVESFLIESIQKKARPNDDDPDDLFCRSLVATLKRLPQKKNQMAKLKIQQLLFDIEYDE
eukprot:gene17397-8996_t